MLIAPLGIWLALRLIPDELMEEFRKVASRFSEQPASFAGMMLVAALWLAIIAIAGLFALE